MKTSACTEADAVQPCTGAERPATSPHVPAELAHLDENTWPGIGFSRPVTCLLRCASGLVEHKRPDPRTCRVEASR